MDDLYKNCRWCHWYKEGACLHERTFKGSTTDIEYLSEEGIVSESIKEGFSEQGFPKLKANLESSLSKKKAKEILQSFFEELESVKIDWTESIDESVTTALQNAADADGKAEIIEPEEFFCKYFM